MKPTIPLALLALSLIAPAALAQGVTLIDGDAPGHAAPVRTAAGVRPAARDAAPVREGIAIRAGTVVREGSKIAVKAVADVRLSDLRTGAIFEVEVLPSGIPIRNNVNSQVTNLPPGTRIAARVLDTQKNRAGQVVSVSFLFDRILSSDDLIYPFLGAAISQADGAGLPDSFHNARNADAEKLSSRESLTIVGLWSGHAPAPLIVGGAILMRIFQGEANKRAEFQRQIQLAICYLDGDITAGDRFAVLATRTFELKPPTADAARPAVGRLNERRPSGLTRVLSGSSMGAGGTMRQ